MCNSAISKLLDMHSIPHYEKDGRIYADSMLAGTKIFEEVEDLTGRSKSDILAWLGY